MQAAPPSEWGWTPDLPNLEIPPSLSGTASPSDYNSSNPDTPQYGEPIGGYFSNAETSLNPGAPAQFAVPTQGTGSSAGDAQVRRPLHPFDHRYPPGGSSHRAFGPDFRSQRYHPYGRPSHGTRRTDNAYDTTTLDTDHPLGGLGATSPHDRASSGNLFHQGPRLSSNAASFGESPMGYAAPTTEDVLLDPSLRCPPPQTTASIPAVHDIVSVIRFTEAASGQAQTMVSVRPSIVWSPQGGVTITDLNPMICTLQPGESIARWQPMGTDQSELRHILLDSAHIGLGALNLARTTDRKTFAYNEGFIQQDLSGICRDVTKALLCSSSEVGERYASAMSKEGSRLPLVKELHLCSPGFPQLSGGLVQGGHGSEMT